MQLQTDDLKKISLVRIPIKVGEKTKHCLGMLDNTKYLGSNYAKGLENFKDKYWRPAENENNYHHS